jgi:predicted nucleic acid-binding protein
VTWAYFDTSALIKRYVDEAGRHQVLQLLGRHQCVTSAVLPVEFRSALRRRVTDRSLDARHVPRILKHFAADRDFWALIEVSSEVRQAAERLVARHPLRTLDAIHVASAELFADRLAAELTFVSADARQTAVAATVGMATEEIGS